MSTPEQRLTELLDQSEAEREKLADRVRELEWKLDGSRLGWSLPREVDDEPSLPLPRLEFAWTPSEDDGWSSFTVEYRLVHRHFTGAVIVIPLGRTETNGGSGKPPWERTTDPDNMLPFRDGAHARHDAAHLGLPLYALLPTGPVRLGEGTGFATSEGRKHRREVSR